MNWERSIERDINAERLKAVLADPLEQNVIHLELDLGLRRVEVTR
jgi:hypothetical protein